MTATGAPVALIACGAVAQRSEASRCRLDTKAREIAEWMGKPLEIHDLGPRPLEDLLAPLMEEATDVHA